MVDIHIYQLGIIHHSHRNLIILVVRARRLHTVIHPFKSNQKQPPNQTMMNNIYYDPSIYSSPLEYTQKIRPTQQSSQTTHWIYAHPQSTSSTPLPPTTDDTPSHDLLSPQLKVIQEGTELINQFLSSQKTRNNRTTIVTKTKPPTLTALREQLRESILDCARSHNYKSGKWLIHVNIEYVDSVWAAVAQATINNELGNTAAKVSTLDPEKLSLSASSSFHQHFVICIYTKDFDDKPDIWRVWKRLKSTEGVFTDSSRPIYYKPDVFTILNLKSETNKDPGNVNVELKLKTSLYDSEKLDVEMRRLGVRLDDTSSGSASTTKKTTTPATTSKNGGRSSAAPKCSFLQQKPIRKMQLELSDEKDNGVVKKKQKFN